MAATTNSTDQVTISRTNSGFPGYLDFNTLRTNAIEYLGPITAAYWTDYNIHDPGITTLESLLYALMDLGYRVNFPIEDLLATKNGSTGAGFFTAGQVLGGNPFTVIDYRKKLMDLQEVRNAWLEPVVAGVGVSGTAAISGIYNVFLELAQDTEDMSGPDWEAYSARVVLQVKEVLQAHRNLCEDFAEPVVLKKKPIVINADIEVSDGASIPQVYQDMVRALYAFFSPAPPYYTLGQLVGMGISLDTIFEGRPYDKWPSHGFIKDGDLPERPTDSTPVYLSAIYNQLLQVEGIETVRKVTLDTGAEAGQRADGKMSGLAPVWVSQLTDDALPVFSITGSTFRWFRKGQLQTAVDVSSYNTMLEQDVRYGGKVWLTDPAALDRAAPVGRFLPGLGDYYSIQNDYPQVYGIGQGGLPVSAPAERKTQALQFKGFLLFFDQLLADYLARVGSLSQLLSISPSGSSAGSGNDDGDPQDTIGMGPGIDPFGGVGTDVGGNIYAPGDVSSVPGLDSLLRFSSGGTAGTLLVYPVAASAWNAIAVGGKVSCAALQGLTPYTFASLNEQQVAVAELVLEFSMLSPNVQYVCVDKQFLYVITSALRSDLVLVSKGLFADQASASKEVATILFIGGARENYQSAVATGDDGEPVYSFNLIQTAKSYYDYVQAMQESPMQYTLKRTAFLNHLMDRFAETFTDYALLSAGFLSPADIANNQVGLLEGFLGNFPELSGDRGKAYNYTRESWDTTNISGLEKRFKAYCGIADNRRHWLCHFEVSEEDRLYRIRLAAGAETLLTCDDIIPEKAVQAAAADLIRSLGDDKQYRLFHHSSTDKWTYAITFDGGRLAQSAQVWPDKAGAAGALGQLARMRKMAPEPEHIRGSKYSYRAELADAEGQVVRRSLVDFDSEAGCQEDAFIRVHDINDAGKWTVIRNNDIGKLVRKRNEQSSGIYIDVRDFDIAVVKEHKPRHFEVRVFHKDSGPRWKLTGHFKEEEAWVTAGHELLFELTEAENYFPISDAGQWKLEIRVDGKVVADSEDLYAGEAEARSAAADSAAWMQKRLYVLEFPGSAVEWKFDVLLGMPGGKTLLLRSATGYSSEDTAQAAAESFYKADKGWEVQSGMWMVKTGSSETAVVEGDPKAAGPLPGLVAVKNSLRAMAAGDPDALATLIQDEETKPRGYVYRVVDKDRPRAFTGLYADAAAAGQARQVLFGKGRHGYAYPLYCLGGDNVYFDGSSWHYRIRCRNDYFTRLELPDREWTMFESVAGYTSEDDAQQAFHQEYLGVIEYREKVFVPDDLQRALTDAGLDAEAELIKAARAYPIRREHDGRFVFVLDEWKSAGRFTDAQQAQVAFDYFRMLLNEPGNYFIEFDERECGWRLGIREVLAESAASFATSEAAWGVDGLEKFITVAQEKGGWHAEKRKDGSWGYFFASPATVKHPVRYDTEQQRDEAIGQLIAAVKGFPANGWVNGGDLADPVTGKVIGRLSVSGGIDEKLLNVLLDMQEAVWAGTILSDAEGLYVEAGGVTLRLVGDVKELSDYFSFFPITRDYRLVMPLPGFEVAWEGVTTYTKAMDAWGSYQALQPLLAAEENYRPVHGSGPGSYGVSLYQPGQIVASSQQTYYYPEMAARAARRASTCINAEGLHLVEHLLLRGDTNVPVCGVQNGGPTLTITASDNTLKTVTPGADPYSFIVTVFLPAWPARWRKRDNRELLERIIQQETPSHILPRIIWLTPADMCRWESAYKQWLHRLTGPAKDCGDFKVDDLVQLLFGKSPACLDSHGSSEWLSEINLFYCWKDMACADTSKWAFDKPVAAVAKKMGIRFVQGPVAVASTAPVKKAGAATASGATGGSGSSSASGATAAAGTTTSGATASSGNAVDDVIDKVQQVDDKVKEASDKLDEATQIAKDVQPLVDVVVSQIPVVGPVVKLAEVAVNEVGGMSKILKRGRAVLGGILSRIKGLFGRKTDKPS